MFSLKMRGKPQNSPMLLRSQVQKLVAHTDWADLPNSEFFQCIIEPLLLFLLVAIPLPERTGTDSFNEGAEP